MKETEQRQRQRLYPQISQITQIQDSNERTITVVFHPLTALWF